MVLAVTDFSEGLAGLGGSLDKALAGRCHQVLTGISW